MKSSPSQNSLSFPQTRSKCVQSCNSILQTGVMSVPSPTSSLTSNYNDDLVYFHSLAFRRLGSPESHAIRFNKPSPPYSERGDGRKRHPPMRCFALRSCGAPIRLHKSQGWRHDMRSRSRVTASFTWSCLVSHSPHC